MNRKDGVKAAGATGQLKSDSLSPRPIGFFVLPLSFRRSEILLKYKYETLAASEIAHSVSRYFSKYLLIER